MGIVDIIKDMWNGPPQKKKAPERRADPRETLIDGKVTIDGNTYPVQNWSKSGYCLGPSDLSFSTGQRLEASFDIPIASGRLNFDCRIAVLRKISDDGSFAGTFMNLEKSVQGKIDDHFKKFEAKK